MPETKYIFVVGGVVSGVGKGIAVASLGRLLVNRGLRVSLQKLDPYLNMDPGTMSPIQHGEVFVTDDGAETDLDLGHYERFTSIPLTRDSSVSSGQIYASVIAKERRGDYLGATVQTIPHVTGEIKERIRRLSVDSKAEVQIVEVGGTIGDIEGLPFLEAIRQMRKDVGPSNVLYIQVGLLPHVGATGELKTKPIQHSVKELRSLGIQPDVIICRSDQPVPHDVREKIALFTDVDVDAVIPLETAASIYDVPAMLKERGLIDYIVDALALPAQTRAGARHARRWARATHPRPTDDLVSNIMADLQDDLMADQPIVIGLVGKYIQLHDAYLSVVEALTHAGYASAWRVQIHWIDAEDLEGQDDDDVAGLLAGLHGIIVPGGFGGRGIEGKIAAARYARLHNVPYLGLCLSMQIAVIEAARAALGTDAASSTEFARDSVHPVISLLAEQGTITDLGGTMRLGSYPCQIARGTLAHRLYGQESINERHRHRYEVNPAYRDILEGHGLVASGTSPDGRLVEMVERPAHPYFIAAQFHPELTSRPDRPHPLFCGLVKAAARLASVARQDHRDSAAA